MSVHMVKLCVGVESLAQYEAWCRMRVERQREAGQEPDLFHVTRMMPKRAEELVGNSLYWVIKGQIQARQRIEAIERIVDTDGVKRCRIGLSETVWPTQWKRKKAFQGWRYLTPRAAPDDLPEGAVGIPDKLRRELDDLGLL